MSSRVHEDALALSLSSVDGITLEEAKNQIQHYSNESDFPMVDEPLITISKVVDSLRSLTIRMKMNPSL